MEYDLFGFILIAGMLGIIPALILFGMFRIHLFLAGFGIAPMVWLDARLWADAGVHCACEQEMVYEWGVWLDLLPILAFNLPAIVVIVGMGWMALKSRTAQFQRCRQW